MSGLSDMNNNNLGNHLYAEDQDEQYQNDVGGNHTVDLWRPHNVLVPNALKRDNEDSLDLHHGIGKRAKPNGADFGGMQPGMAQRSFSIGMDSNNVLNSQMFASQQRDFMPMSNAGLGLMERRLEEETNRNQQQSFRLANEVLMSHQMNIGNGSAAFGGMHSVNVTAQGIGASQRQQQFYDPNAELHNNTNSASFGQMQGFQDLQSLSHMSSMGNQQFFSGMLDYSNLLNHRLAQQGFGGFGAGAGNQQSASSNMTVLNSSLEQPMSAGSISNMSQLPTAGFCSAQAGSQAVNHMGALNNAAMMQFSRMNVPSSQQQVFVPQQSQLRGTEAMAASQQNHQAMQHMTSTQQRGLPAADASSPGLPPLEEAQTPHYSQRPFYPFAIEEDSNWLSEFQCFIRSEILELFRVSREGIKVRNAVKSLTVNQVGIRCRFCAHLMHGTRANRASCFPSKIDKIYQSFTMMLREHFPFCNEIPEASKKRFTQLQSMNAQGASNAKGFWEHAAKKKGMVDISEHNGRGGIHIFDHTQAQAALIAPFGAEGNFAEPQPPIPLVNKSDKPLVSNFLYTLMEQVYRVHLAPSERKGNRKSLRPGMPGFGCRYCYVAGRMGLCRLFPARRRTIHTKIPDLFDHIKRCPLCPQQVKDRLIFLHKEENGGMTGDDHDTESRGREREFFERIWSRLGHRDDSE